MEENERTKEKKCQTFRFEKGSHSRGEVFYTFVLYKEMRVKVVLLLFVCLFVGGGISQRPN